MITIGHIMLPDWWFVTFFLFFHILGFSSSQLTHIFQRGRYTTNQLLTNDDGVVFLSSTAMGHV